MDELRPDAAIIFINTLVQVLSERFVFFDRSGIEYAVLPLLDSHRANVFQAPSLQLPVNFVDVLQNQQLVPCKTLFRKNRAHTRRQMFRSEMRLTEDDHQRSRWVTFDDAANMSRRALVSPANAAHVITWMGVDAENRDVEFASG